MVTSVTSKFSSKAVQRLTWEGLAAGETGDGGQLGRCRQGMVVQASGTFNTETVTLEGSLDGVTWSPLTEDGTNAIALTAAGIALIYEPVGWVRPVVSAGAGVDIDIIVEGFSGG